MKTFVVEWVLWQQNKEDNIKTPWLLQQLAITNQHSEEVWMDFITCLPKYEETSVIMILGDWMTNYSHFLSLSHPFKASIVEKELMDIVQKIHGIKNIIMMGKLRLWINA